MTRAPKIDGDLDALLRRKFADELDECLRTDLTLAMLDVLLDNQTDPEIIDGITDFPALEREIAYALFVRFVSGVQAGRAEIAFQDALLRALVDSDSPWQLKLTYGRRGRPKSAFNDVARWRREWEIFEKIKGLIESGVKVESAIHEVALANNISRSKGFEIWQRRSKVESRQRFELESLEGYSSAPQAKPEPQRRSWWQRFFDHITQEF